MKIFFFILKKQNIVIEQKKRLCIISINKIKVETIGRSVETNNEDKNLNNILIWHFIWSKYYFSKIKIGNLISLIIFTPLLLKIVFRIFLYKILKIIILSIKTNIDLMV